jgi:membrane protease YdiL (CAAX protease family)
MAIESVAFAIGLWALSRELNPLLKSFGVVLQTRAQAPSQQQVLAQVITFVGAGIYEEILFRLLLFGGLIWVFKNTGFLSLFTLLFAAVASAALFSAAHHAGPNGEPFNGYAFLFRTLAGLYFTLLFRLRGFGVAVGTHACYDVFVGIIAP